ncbi:hypothetical protein GYH30_052538 [Glycine max]|nr:hypothetical protein GYH30_052538 [Glycine max]
MLGKERCPETSSTKNNIYTIQLYNQREREKDTYRTIMLIVCLGVCCNMLIRHRGRGFCWGRGVWMRESVKRV